MCKKIGIFVITAVLIIALTSMPIFADTYTNNAPALYSFSSTFYGTNSDIDDGNLLLIVFRVTSHQLVIENFDSYSDGSVATAHFTQLYDVNVYISNSTSYNLQLDVTSLRFRPYFENDNGTYIDSTHTSTYIDNIEGDLFSGTYFTGTTGLFYLRWAYDNSNDSGLIIPANTSYSGSFNIVRDGYSYLASETSLLTYVYNTYSASCTSIANLSTISVTDLGDDVTIYNSDYNSQAIKENTQAILDAYTNNSENAQAVTDGTSTNEETLAAIGTNEDTWFSQNDSALTATGISDFEYTPTVMSGMSVISDQFNQLWTAIGDWNFVYTFSMMLGLVVLILRHNPQRKKSGGGKNASSS